MNLYLTHNLVIDQERNRDTYYDPGLPFNSRHCGVNAARFPTDLSPMKIFAELLTKKLECKIIAATNSFERSHYGSVLE
jgi:hypothetical protein